MDWLSTMGEISLPEILSLEMEGLLSLHAGWLHWMNSLIILQFMEGMTHQVTLLP